MLVTGSATDLRRHNRDAVLGLIKTHGAISRTGIAHRVGLTNAAVSRICKELIDAGLIEEGERVVHKGQAGRRQVSLQLSEHGAFVLGIAVTLNAREIVIANGRGDIIGRTDCSDISLNDPASALRTFARRAKALIRRTGIDQHRLIGGAASVAGRVDPDTGRLIGADPLGWEGQTVAATFEQALGIPFIAEGRAAALLELERSLGPAAGCKDLLLVNVGLRYGSALMVDGNLLRGTNNGACVLNKFRVKPSKTLDDIASGFAILRQLAKIDHKIPSGTDPGNFLRRYIEQGQPHDRATAAVFRKCGAALGRAIHQLEPVLAPQLVILAGFVTRHSAYVAGVRSKLKRAPVEIQVSRFTTAQSAVHLALTRHLFNETLDIEQLMAA